MEFTWESVLIIICLVGVFGTIGYMVTTSIIQSREEKRRLREFEDRQIYEVDPKHHPSKSFVGPGNHRYREDYDADLRVALPNTILATDPSLANTIAAASLMSALESDPIDYTPSESAGSSGNVSFDRGGDTPPLDSHEPEPPSSSYESSSDSSSSYDSSSSSSDSGSSSSD